MSAASRASADVTFSLLCAAANSFCLAHVRVDLEARRVSLPALFRRYASDFGATPVDVLKRACGMMAPLGSKAPHESFANLTILLQTGADKIALEYQPVNYTPNGVL